MDYTTFTIKWDALNDGEFPLAQVANIENVIVVIKKTGIFSRLIDITFINIGHSTEGEKMTTAFMFGQLIQSLGGINKIDVKI